MRPPHGAFGQARWTCPASTDVVGCVLQLLAARNAQFVHIVPWVALQKHLPDPDVEVMPAGGLGLILGLFEKTEQQQHQAVFPNCHGAMGFGHYIQDATHPVSRSSLALAQCALKDGNDCSLYTHDNVAVDAKGMLAQLRNRWATVQCITDNLLDPLE